MSSRNRTAGHNFERQIVQELKILGFPEAVTSRAESKNMDDKGVDICNTPGYQFQCKNMKLIPNYHKILSEMPGNSQINILVHRKTKKSKSRFITEGDYIVLKKEDFYILLEKLNIAKSLKT
jgi:hypothetical protein